jgi:hypothetical protein
MWQAPYNIGINNLSFLWTKSPMTSTGMMVSQWVERPVVFWVLLQLNFQFVPKKKMGGKTKEGQDLLPQGRGAML